MKTKLLGSLVIMLGVFLFAGVAAAADADVLQPASDVVYNENVDINGSLNVDSLRVGTAGLGGVTFFNETVLNEGADPFTVGDDMRVDGEIWRGPKGGDPLKISDNVIPTLDYANNLGSSTNRWAGLFAGDGYFSSLEIGSDGGLFKALGGAEISSDLYVTGTSEFSHRVKVKQLNVNFSYGNNGVRIKDSGDI